MLVVSDRLSLLRIPKRFNPELNPNCNTQNTPASVLCFAKQELFVFQPQALKQYRLLGVWSTAFRRAVLFLLRRLS